MIYKIISNYPFAFWPYKQHSINPEIGHKEIWKLFKEVTIQLLEEDPPPLTIRRRIYAMSCSIDSELAVKVESIWGDCHFQLSENPTEEELIESVFSFGKPAAAEFLSAKYKELYLLFFNNRFKEEEIWLSPYFSAKRAITFLEERQMELNESGISTLADWLFYLVGNKEMKLFLSVLRPLFRNLSLLDALSLERGHALKPFLCPLLEMARGNENEAYRLAHQAFHPSLWKSLIPLGFSVEILLNLSPSEPSRSFIVRYLESLAYLHTSETLPKD